MPHTDFIAPNGDTDWPSVTGVLDVLAKPQLYRWYAKHGWDVAIQILTDSGDLGSKVHDEIHTRLLMGGQPGIGIDPQVNKLVDKLWSDFIVPYNVKAVKLEQKVVSLEHRYHGTYDGIIHVTNLPIGIKQELYTGELLVDWKTSNAIYDSQGIQLGGYWLADSTAPNDGLIVQINKETGDIRKRFFPNLEFYAEEFKHLRSTWDYVHKKGRWK